MTRRLTYVAPRVVKKAIAATGGFVKEMATYMVMDDLVVKPMSAISSIALLNKFNVKDVGVLEEKVVNLGMEEALKLLKASFESKTVLTSAFMSTGEELCEAENELQHIIKLDVSVYSCPFSGFLLFIGSVIRC